VPSAGVAYEAPTDSEYLLIQRPNYITPSPSAALLAPDGEHPARDVKLAARAAGVRAALPALLLAPPLEVQQVLEGSGVGCVSPLAGWAELTHRW
jgi:hypothetical protein